MKNTCIEVSVYGEKLYRLFLDIIKLELDALCIADINSIQALTLINIGNNTITIGELTAKGYYAGSNASYNIKKMTNSGYITQEPSIHDKRACYIKLSEKGKDLYNKLMISLEKYNNVFKSDSNKSNFLETCIDAMKKVNTVWNDVLINYI